MGRRENGLISANGLYYGSASRKLTFNQAKETESILLNYPKYKAFCLRKLAEKQTPRGNDERSIFEIVAAIDKVFLSLPAEYREIVTRRYFKSMNYISGKKAPTEYKDLQMPYCITTMQRVCLYFVRTVYAEISGYPGYNKRFLPPARYEKKNRKIDKKMIPAEWIAHTSGSFIPSGSAAVMPG